jgi:EAL and modified HD-GYP domain-containing signal transduction protein
MATQVIPIGSYAALLSEQAEGLRYIARQPILDLRGKVHGYELLFRSGPEASFSGDGNQATRTMLDNLVVFGLEKLTCGLPAFVNCTMESLVDDLVQVLPPGMAVLEIEENEEPTQLLLDSCGKLKAAGYRLALDDFTWKPEIKPLVKLAHYVKVDFSQTRPEERKALLKQLKGMAVTLIAEKVETQEEYQQACAEGFTLIQGYYFCRPVLLKGRKIPANRLSRIQMLQLLQHDPLDLRRVSEELKRDASLTFRLLRLVNSPLYARRHEVRSIESALIMVGDNAFRRVAMLAITCELNSDQSQELLRMAFVRGRFCELAAAQCGMNPTEQYLLGMLSLLPAMLRKPMSEMTPVLPLSREICQALEGLAVPERRLLEWLVRNEYGDWDMCDTIAQTNDLDQKKLACCYADAMVWTESVLAQAV